MNAPFMAMIIPMGEAPGGGGGTGIWGPTDPRPTPPIHMPGGGGGGSPPGIWGGGNVPMPNPPIVIPPQNPGDPPLVIWGGGNVPMPTPPIHIPDAGEPPTGGEPVRLVEWKTGWTEDTGWIVIGVPQGPTPTPSKK